MNKRKRKDQKEKRKTQNNDDSSDDGNDDGKRRKKSPNTQKKVINKALTQTFSQTPFKKIFWTGEKGQNPPSESVKQIRKQLGVVVRGRLDLCPTPIHDTSEKFFPREMEKAFTIMGFRIPSSVQQQCWPAILCGANLLV